MIKFFDVTFQLGEYHVHVDGASYKTTNEDQVKSELDEWVEGNQ
jgi:hypothetical protein